MKMKKRLIAKNPSLSDFTIDTQVALQKIKNFDGKLDKDHAASMTKNRNESRFAGLYFDINHDDDPPYIYSIEWYIYNNVNVANGKDNYLGLVIVKLSPNSNNTNANLDETYTKIAAFPAGNDVGSTLTSMRKQVIVDGVTLQLLENITNYADAYKEAMRRLEQLRK